MSQRLIRWNGEWVQVASSGVPVGGDTGGTGGTAGGTPGSGGTGNFIEPTVANTGPNPEVTLTTISGDYHVAADNTNLSGKYVTGNLHVDANNVTVTDTRCGALHSNENGPIKQNHRFIRVKFGVYYCNGLKDVLFDYCQGGIGIPNVALMQTAYYSSTLHDLTRTDCSGLTMMNCFVGLPGTPDPTNHTHREALHMLGTNGVLLRNCTFDYTLPGGQPYAANTTACLTMEGSTYCSNVTIDNCYFYGGGPYQLYLYGPGLVVTNNKCHSYAGMGGVQYTNYPPPMRWWHMTEHGNTLDGNPITLWNPADY